MPRSGRISYFFSLRVPAGVTVNLRMLAVGTGTATPNWPEMRSATESRWYAGA